MRPPPVVRKGPRSLPAARGVEHNELVQLEVRIHEQWLARLEDRDPPEALQDAVRFYCE